jgi:hypothetical protein
MWNRKECRKKEGNGNLKTAIPYMIMTDQKGPENVEYTNYPISMIKKDA